MKIKLKLFLGITLIILIAGSTFIPTGYDILFAESPVSLNEYIHLDDEHDINGEIAMTYVSIFENVSWPVFLKGILTKKGVEIEKAESVALDMSEDDLYIQSKMMMEQSKIKSEFLARKFVGENPQIEMKGFYPIEFISDWKFKDVLKVNDIIVEVDGKSFRDYGQLQNFISKKQPNHKINLLVEREGELTNIEVATYPDVDINNNTFLGVQLEEFFQINSEKNIQMLHDDIGGPSAGLMFTLTLIEKMTKESLLKGNKVAGTGTIEMDGTVGAVSGIKQKVIGAAQAGYEYFFVPKNSDFYNNEEIAKKTGKEDNLSIKIIPIGTLDEAMEALRNL